MQLEKIIIMKQFLKDYGFVILLIIYSIAYLLSSPIIDAIKFLIRKIKK